MRKPGLILLAAAMAAFPNAAFSQEGAEGPPPTADDFVCALSDECPGDEATDQSGRPRVSATRGFQLSRPTATTRTSPTTSQPRSSQRQTGAAAQRRVDLRLSFGAGSAVLSESAQAQLRAFADALRRPQLANARVRIEGHTDSSGGRAVNRSLSQRRAQAAADFLVRQGIAASRLEVRGYGYDRPLPGRSAAARENRRVEAVRIS